MYLKRNVCIISKKKKCIDQEVIKSSRRREMEKFHGFTLRERDRERERERERERGREGEKRREEKRMTDKGYDDSSDDVLEVRQTDTQII